MNINDIKLLYIPPDYENPSVMYSSLFFLNCYFNIIFFYKRFNTKLFLLTTYESKVAIYYFFYLLNISSMVHVKVIAVSFTNFANIYQKLKYLFFLD